MPAYFSMYQSSGGSVYVKEEIFTEQVISCKLWSTPGTSARGSKKSFKGWPKLFYVLDQSFCSVVICGCFVGVFWSDATCAFTGII